MEKFEHHFPVELKVKIYPQTLSNMAFLCASLVPEHFQTSIMVPQLFIERK